MWVDRAFSPSNPLKCLRLHQILAVVSGDNHVFAFLLAVEKMMNNGSVSREEWQLFTQLPINSQAERALDGDIPKWVSRKVWEVRQ